MNPRDAAIFQVLCNVMNHAIVNQQLVIICQQRRIRRRRNNAFWVRPWLGANRRLQYGHYDGLMEELRAEDASFFFKFMRMEPAMFDKLLHRVSSRISKDDRRMRKTLDPGLKFAVTLRYLASGDKFTSLQYDFRVSRVTIKKLLPDVCQVIVEEYSGEVITYPMEADAWREVAEAFKTKWNVPHAVGALDGKHIAIGKPPHRDKRPHLDLLNYMLPQESHVFDDPHILVRIGLAFWGIGSLTTFFPQKTAETGPEVTIPALNDFYGDPHLLSMLLPHSFLPTRVLPPLLALVIQHLVFLKEFC